MVWRTLLYTFYRMLISNKKQPKRQGPRDKPEIYTSAIIIFYWATSVFCGLFLPTSKQKDTHQQTLLLTLCKLIIKQKFANNIKEEVPNLSN